VADLRIQIAAPVYPNAGKPIGRCSTLLAAASYNRTSGQGGDAKYQPPPKQPARQTEKLT
jgi:hypothetical protein